jgi:hypothetical protein
VPRDWLPRVVLDRSSGLAFAGGYTGEGVAAANLAGRTLADLILKRDTDLVHHPWVGGASRNWEPEPFRWMGATGVLELGNSADRFEFRNDKRPRLRGAIFDFFVRK